MMQAFKKQRELYKKTQELRSLDLHNVDFQKSKEIREEEQRMFDKWTFYKKLRKEMEKGKNNE